MYIDSRGENLCHCYVRKLCKSTFMWGNYSITVSLQCTLIIKVHFLTTIYIQAFRRGVRYPTHLLLTFQWYEERWWLKENGASDVNLTCTAEERERVLTHSLAFNFVLSDYLKNRDVTTDVGIVRRLAAIFLFFIISLTFHRLVLSIFQKRKITLGLPHTILAGHSMLSTASMQH